MLERLKLVGGAHERTKRPKAGRMLLLGAALIVAASALVLGTSGAFGGPSPSLFQLDGNTVHDAIPGDDWNDVFAGTSGAFSSTFIPYSKEGPSDKTTTRDTTAWTPSTKVTDPISSWSWQTNTSVIDAKADITDAYAAAYKTGADGTDTVMYFGLDRFDESGDANVGFWFLQDPNFSLNTDGTFSGQHLNGDIFIKSGFLQGGGVAVPTAYEWQNGSLTLIQTGALCTTSQQSLCAIDNDGTGGRPGTLTVPWAYQDKDGSAVGTIKPNGFFEGGFDLGSQFNTTDLPCFTHFVAQTATSSGNSETLKDLAAGNVESCGSVELKKHWAGAAGTATLKIGTSAGGTEVASKQVTADGTTGAQQEHVGTYYVSEAFDSSSYTQSLACFNDKNENGSQDTGENTVTTTAADNNSASFQLGVGDHVVCTYTNTPKPGTLIVEKHVVNDNGGTAVAGDWSLHVKSGGSDVASSPQAGSESGTSYSVAAGTYTVSESGGPSGYSFDGYSLDCGSDGTVTVAAGQTKTCKLTNNDVQPTLTVIKHVVNDNGGSAVAGDWSLHVKSGGNDVASSPQSGSEAGTVYHLDAGSYVVSESGGPSGYSFDGFSLDCGSDGSVTLGVGQNLSCKLTNNDVGPTLTVIKHVVNDNGGTAVAGDWSLHVKSGGSDVASSPQAGSEAGTVYQLPAGTYTVSESGGPSGYSFDGYSLDCGSDGSVTLGVGDNKTCKLTNNDIGPTIDVAKRIVPSNDSGRFNFTIDANTEGQQLLDNGTDGYGNGDSTGQVGVSAGDHTVSESGNGNTKLSDYASTWSCSSNGERSQSGTGTTISLKDIGLAEDVSCTFTNTRLATLVVVKKVDNSNGGGSKGPGDFSLHVSAAGFDLPGSPAAGSATGTTYGGLMPGTYKVSEDAVSGYSLTSITGCLADGSVQLEAGQTVTCTLTNTSAAPPPPPPPPPPAPKIDLAITKTGTPNPAVLGNKITWTMVVTNNGPNGATGVTVADPVPAGTTFVSVATSTGTCTGGATVNCSLGNLAVGSSVTITLVTTANVTGTLTNTATTVGNEQETNTANNTASASVVVNGPFVPPVHYCTAVRVSPKTLFVGRQVKLTLKVSQNGKAVRGIRIKIKGATIAATTKASNGHGMVTVIVKPRRAGIVTIVPVSTKGCANPRIGVTGVFTPPVTG